MHILRYSRELFIAALLTGLLVSALSAQQGERYSVAGDAVAVYNLAGRVSVEAGTGSNVVVEVVPGGDDAGELRVDRIESDGRNALVIRYPDDDIVYRNGAWRGNATIRVRGDGTFGESRGGDRVKVKSSGSGVEAHADLRVLVPEGKAVSVYLGVGRIDARNVRGDLNLDVASAAVRTENTRGALLIDTGSGSVRVNDAEGDVSVDTGSGSVAVNNVRGGRLHVDTGSGSVEGGEIRVGSVEVDTGSGRIDLDRVAARDLKLDTGSGSVRLELLSEIDRLQVDTGSGSVRVALPESVGADFVLDTGSGGIDLDVPATITRRQRDRVEGRLGNGGGRIEIDTGSGSIRVGRSL